MAWYKDYPVFDKFIEEYSEMTLYCWEYWHGVCLQAIDFALKNWSSNRTDGFHDNCVGWSTGRPQWQFVNIKPKSYKVRFWWHTLLFKKKTSIFAEGLFLASTWLWQAITYDMIKNSLLQPWSVVKPWTVLYQLSWYNCHYITPLLLQDIANPLAYVSNWPFKCRRPLYPGGRQR